MRNSKFVQIVVWALVILVVLGLILPVFTSILGIF